MRKQKLYILGIFVILAIILGVVFRDKIKKWFTGEQYFYIDGEEEINENEAIINNIEQLLPLLRQRNFEDLFNIPNINNMILQIGNNIELRNYVQRLPDFRELINNILDFQRYANERLVRQRELREQPERMQNNLRIQELQQEMQQRQQQRQQELREERQQYEEGRQQLEEQRQLRLQRYRELERDRLRQIQQQFQEQIEERRQLQLEQIKENQEREEILQLKQQEKQILEKQLMQRVVKQQEKSKSNMIYFIGITLFFMIVFIIFEFMNKKRK